MRRETYQYFLKKEIVKFVGVKDSNFERAKNNFIWKIEVSIKYPEISLEYELDKIYFEACDLLKSKDLKPANKYEHFIAKNKNHIISIKFKENI